MSLSEPPSGDPVALEEAARAADECAFYANLSCQALFRARRLQIEWPAHEVRPWIDDLTSADAFCHAACSPWLAKLAAVHECRVVDGWDGDYPSGCAALQSFAARVLTELFKLHQTGFADLADFPAFYSLEPPRPGYFRALVAQEFSMLRVMNGGRGRGPAPRQTPPAVQPHADGPEGGCWVWWQNKRHDVPKGNVYKLLEFMWDRDSASYEALIGPVFDDDVAPQTVRSYANKVNNALQKIGIPWRLTSNSVTRHITRKSAD